MFIREIVFAVFYIFISVLIYLVLFVFNSSNSKNEKYPNITILSSELIHHFLVVSAIDECVKFIPKLKHFPLLVIISKRPFNVSENTAARGSVGSFWIKPFVTIYAESDELEEEEFIKIFIHELFHALGFGCGELWIKSIIVENKNKYLSLENFPHTKKYYKEKIKLSDDGAHLSEEYEDEIMQPVFYPENRATFLSLCLLKDILFYDAKLIKNLSNKINLIKTNNKYFNIKKIA